MSTTLCIELNRDEFLDVKVVRLEKGWKLHFMLGESLRGLEVRLLVPDAVGSAPYEAFFPGLRLDARESLEPLQGIANLDSQIYQEFSCDNFGLFSYEFFEPPNSTVPIGRGYFFVIPQWQIADGAKTLSLNSLNVCTYLTKPLGPLVEWERRLRVAKESGFNVIHLTPVQKLGISNSSYSIAEYDQLNPLFDADFDALESLVKKLEYEWQMLTIQDVVWNHAAKNAKWLHEHPECAYNLQNSPHLRPAYILDRALSQFSREIATDKWAPQGLPSVICEESHLSCLRHLLSDQVLPSVKLWEFFQVDVDKMLQEFEHLFKEAWPSPDEAEEDFFSIPLDQDEQFRRFGSTIDLKRVARIFAAEKLKFEECTDRLRAMLRDANAGARHIVEGHIVQAIDAILGHVTYERVAGHGPRKGKVTAENPLVTEYFLHPVDHQNQGWEEDEKLAYDPTVSTHLMAFNGWVMSANPLANFAEWPSQVYLRRELVCWGDSVKLNYGRERANCPFLWEYMVRYTEQCARIFHGFRIDNAHSTPIHVAEYLLKAARQVRPNLYVVAELFTGSERHDNIFVNRLGITSLIREAQNAPDSHEQGRFVYRYGGDPVGAFHHKSTRPAPWAVAHALFYDQTHDNPSPIQKRTAYDVLPTAAMTAIGYCASGSVRGYDEFVPAHIDVVKETRLYRMWSEFGQEPQKEGMFRARRLLNDLHYQLGITGFSEIFVDQVNEDVVAVTRHNPCTQESVLLIAHTCFSKFKWTPSCRPISVDGDIAAILFELKTVEEPMKDNGVVQKTAQLPDRITGLPNFHVECYENVPLDKSDAIEIEGGQQIRFKLFLSGSVVVLKINPKADTKKACAMIQETISNKQTREEARKLLSPLTFHDFNFLLFRCEPEEMAEFGSGAFDISKHGKLPYCGLMGIRTLLQRIQKANDLGHPLCDNLRHGTWLADYTIGRLQRNPALQPLAQFLQKAFAPLRDVPHYSRPCYFELLFSCFYAVVEEAFLEHQFNLVGTNIKYIPRIKLTERLCIAANAFLARISNALLPPTASMPAEQQLSLSAGLPHFAEGIWRNWGRDTFIALPGLLLLTGRYEEARQMILAYAGTLRHGLIPNLLAEGKAPRYNCRDAVWFWLAAIVQYVELLPWEDGKKILEEQVLRLYPTDDSNYRDAQKTEPLHATMYEALCRHFAGIDFRERNAGSQIDEHMRDEGFNVRAYIDPETGLVFGGNRWNCGTWMDKMGSSERAGNRGEPATPRDGAAVELQGLALRVAKALDEYSRNREEVAFPYTAMKAGDATLTWADWAAKIRNSFTDKFFVGSDCEDQFVNRRGIIKDTFGSSLQYTDFQLRPNFCIALDAAPDIIDSEKAWSALETAGKVLAQNAPLGICTLDPEDWAYNGHYNNDDDGMNKATAKGWNYHQGPEWLWIACTYMNAKLKVAQRRAQETGEQRFFNQTLEEVRLRLCRFERTMAESDWASLPELTNRGGLPCAHSCPAQAWSIGCALETVHLLDSSL